MPYIIALDGESGGNPRIPGAAPIAAEVSFVRPEE
jgi:hypothetical protein